MAKGGSRPRGKLAAHSNLYALSVAPPCLFFPPQLIPLQAPLKTLLQIGVMPLLNGRD